MVASKSYYLLTVPEYRPANGKKIFRMSYQKEKIKILIVDYVDEKMNGD